MIRTIILFSPIFVTVFWSIALIGNKKEQSPPRLFLSKFMIFPLVCFITHFLYFEQLPTIYIFFDFPYQYAGSLILPVYYIYFRLLTVDEKFSFKAHARYLAIPFIIATIYCIAAILTPSNEYKTWLFDEYAFPESQYIQFLTVMRDIQRIQFLLLVLVTLIANHLLIRKYSARAEQFYSDINDGKYNNAKMLNYSILMIGVASFIAVAIGRRFLMPKEAVIYVVWSILTVMMYIIGYMGFNQKPINPTFESVIGIEVQKQLVGKLNGTQNRILEGCWCSLMKRKYISTVN